MEVEASDAEPIQPDSPIVIDEHKLPELIASASLLFQDWTSLISEVDAAFSDDIEKLGLVYDAFLLEFPLCYGYWRKYANHAIRLCTVDKVVELFERVVGGATYCVDLWVDYCSFGCLVFEDPADVRRLFQRGLSYVGKDYLCHALWDKYIEFEFSQPSNGEANPAPGNTENEGGSIGQRREKLVISEEYFQRVTQALVMRLRQHEEAILRDGSGLAG